MSVNVLLLGPLTSEEQNEFFLAHGIRPAPADIVQKYLLEGLSADTRIAELKAICSTRIQACNKNGIKKVDDRFFKISRGDIESVGFLNLPAIGFAQREHRIVAAAKRWAKSNIGKDTVVLIYSMHSPFLHAAKKIKDILPSARIGLIVPDLPQYMGSGNALKRFLKKIDRKKIDHYLKSVDKYILYTKYMAEYFNLSEGQWCVFEGAVDISKIKPNEKTEPSKRICMYAGSLSRLYALDLLVDSFEKADVNAELHLYGSPSEGEALMSRHLNCKKTRYMGTLSQQEVFEKMREATLLVNPRPSDLELTKYSCPSKTFEYMASGTPVLMTKLQGIPDEYYPHLYFFEKEDEAGFVEGLEKILSFDISVLNEKAKLAAEFLSQNKGAIKQAQKVMDFIL